LHGTDRFGKWVTVRDQFDGWWDSPDTKGESADRDGADGEYDLPVYNQARILTIGGNLHAMPGQIHEAGNFLRGPMLGRLQVTMLGLTQWADAKRVAGVRFTPVTDRLAQWQVRLKCPDPRKFGEFDSVAVSAGAPASLYHRGNYDASPVIRVHGPTAAYTVTGPAGEQYTVTGGLGAGNEHVIDFNDGLLRVNGAITAAAVSKAELWVVPPGQKVTASLSAGNGHIDLLDTFI
jgi:hypothetical protein